MNLIKKEVCMIGGSEIVIQALTMVLVLHAAVFNVLLVFLWINVTDKVAMYL